MLRSRESRFSIGCSYASFIYLAVSDFGGYPGNYSEFEPPIVISGYSPL